jgi:hypothetical protein
VTIEKPRSKKHEFYQLFIKKARSVSNSIFSHNFYAFTMILLGTKATFVTFVMQVILKRIPTIRRATTIHRHKNT